MRARRGAVLVGLAMAVSLVVVPARAGVADPFDHRLHDVAAIAADDAWAVGDDLIVHWDGSAWAVGGPSIMRAHTFAAVAARNAADVWVAGWIVVAGPEPAVDPALRREHLDAGSRAAPGGRGTAQRRRRPARRRRVGGRHLRPLHADREPRRRPRVSLRRRDVVPGRGAHARRGPLGGHTVGAHRPVGRGVGGHAASGIPPRSAGTAAAGASTGSPSTSGTPSRRTSSRSGTAG